MSEKSRYPVPVTLGIEHATYLRWLRRKAAAHLKRDRKRFSLVFPGLTRDPASSSDRAERQRGTRSPAFAGAGKAGEAGGSGTGMRPTETLPQPLPR